MSTFLSELQNLFTVLVDVLGEQNSLRGLYVQSAWTFFSWWTFIVSGHEQGLDKMYVCYSEESRPLWPALFI